MTAKPVSAPLERALSIVASSAHRWACWTTLAMTVTALRVSGEDS
jgi:hypothetical protein